MAPIYFKWVADVNALEVLSHRVLWSAIFLLAVILLTRRWSSLLLVLRDRGKRNILFITAILVSVNWLIFIYAVATDRIMDSSLGYYINPLFNVFLGFMFLGERLRIWQGVAIGLAILGVLNEIITRGSLPWIALALPLTFAVYGLLRKKAGVDPIVGLCIETLLLLPLTIVYLIWITV